MTREKWKTRPYLTKYIGWTVKWYYLDFSSVEYISEPLIQVKNRGTIMFMEVHFKSGKSKKFFHKLTEKTKIVDKKWLWKTYKEEVYYSSDDYWDEMYVGKNEEVQKGYDKFMKVVEAFKKFNKPSTMLRKYKRV